MLNLQKKTKKSFFNFKRRPLQIAQPVPYDMALNYMTVLYDQFPGQMFEGVGARARGQL